MEENKKNIFNKSHFSKNIKSLFIKESQNYYNKHRLNLKLKSLIRKEKSLNDRKIIDFNYGKMFHFFKVNMKKFDDGQLKRKNFYKSLYEENTRFNKEYQKNFSSNTQITHKQTKPNIKSKTFQKFYDKHQITDTSKQVNNLFKRDPLLVSNNDIKLFYMSKETENGEDEFDDEALKYVNKLENNINQKSVLNKVRNALFNNKKRKKEKKLSLNKEKDFPIIEDSKSMHEKNKIKNLKNEFISKNYYKKYSMDMKRYNRNLKEMISKLNKTNNNDFNFKNKHLSFENNNKNYNNKRNGNTLNLHDIDNENQKTNYYSCYSKNIGSTISDIKIDRKKEKNRSSNQIESLYNALFQIKKNISKYEKKNENEIKYLYTIFGHNSGKKIKQSFIENQKLIKLDKELVYSVNSFND
jgi:hypothetical protein